MPTIHRDSHDIHYEVVGRPGAPPLLLVMGMGFSSRAWHTLPELLRDDFRVVVFDNCGTGRSSAPRRLYRTRRMAEDAAAVLDALGLERVFVFGISMGGMIAQELALAHPERVRALALGATFAGHLRSTKPSPAVAFELVRAVVRGERVAPRHLARLLVSREYFTSDPEGFGRWMRIVEPVRGYVALRQALAVALHETRRRLPGLRVPTLVVTGDADRLVPPANSHELARLIPGARLLVLRGAGHVFPVERPAETVSALRSFFLGEHGRSDEDRGEAEGVVSEPPGGVA
ncbi:MAG TPA: alpha/beta fold hydrolase [Anaeromyxobacteraceae bacterium]|nr:alpha/beta fold hydrolase [Anaeromyxobacteraceae bacterium]